MEEEENKCQRLIKEKNNRKKMEKEDMKCLKEEKCTERKGKKKKMKKERKENGCLKVDG
jgi:hypothetical protein